MLACFPFTAFPLSASPQVVEKRRKEEQAKKEEEQQQQKQHLQQLQKEGYVFPPSAQRAQTVHTFRAEQWDKGLGAVGVGIDDG